MSGTAFVIGAVSLSAVLVGLVARYRQRPRETDRYRRTVSAIHRSNDREARHAEQRTRRQPDIFPEPWQ